MISNSFIKWAAILAAAYATLKYVSSVEPEWLQVRHVPLKMRRLAPEFHGYRVVQISDIHLDTSFGEAWLKSIIQQVNILKPNLITITGDFITHRLSPYDDQLIEALSQLKSTDAKVAVLGNHDHWVDAKGVRRIINESGIIDISNKVHSLRRGSAQFHVAGVDDIWVRKNRLDKVMQALPDNGAAMLLAHEPDFADQSAATGRFDLQISGHTHGGIIDILGAKPPWWLMPPHGKKYKVGLYRVGEMWQYTNRGVGVIIPFRLNCRPEITVFTLESPSGNGVNDE